MKKGDGLNAGNDLGAPHNRGRLQYRGPELPAAKGAHRILLSEMQNSETLGSMFHYQFRGHQGLNQGGRLQL